MNLIDDLGDIYGLPRFFTPCCLHFLHIHAFSIHHRRKIFEYGMRSLNSVNQVS